MYWIIKKKSKPQINIIHDPVLMDNNGYTCAMRWIINCKTLPPWELLHEPSRQIMKLYNTYYDKLGYPYYSIDVNAGLTCAMIWIDVVNTLPPKELLHDPSIQDVKGMTCMMHWIQNNIPALIVLNDIKEATVSYDDIKEATVSLDDIKDATVSYDEDKISIEIHSCVIPKELIHNPKIQDVNGETCAMYWIRKYRTKPPKELMYRDNDLYDLCSFYGIGSLVECLESLKEIPDYPNPPKITKKYDDPYNKCAFIDEIEIEPSALAPITTTIKDLKHESKGKQYQFKRSLKHSNFRK